MSRFLELARGRLLDDWDGLAQKSLCYVRAAD